MLKNRYLAFTAAALFAVLPSTPFTSCTAWGHQSSVTNGVVQPAHGTWGTVGKHAYETPPSPPTPPKNTKPPVTPNYDNNIVPKNGTLMGAYVLAGHGGPGREGAVLALESATGRKLDIDHRYEGLTDALLPQFSWDVARGVTPMMSWSGKPTTEIAAGQWDSAIISMARQVKALNAPILIRFMYEMDGNPHAEAKFVQSPASYIASWRRVVTLFRQQGATNAQFIWCPMAYGFRPNGGRAPQFYPGDAYVDWVGADGYNWAPGRGGNYASFQSIFANFYNWTAKNTPDKPLFVAETGVQERNPGDKASWITAMGNTIKNVYPRIKAVTYFDSNPRYPWFLDSSASSMAAWRNLLHQPYFNTRNN